MDTSVPQTRLVRVNLDTDEDRSYDILIERNLLAKTQLPLEPNFTVATRFYLVSDRHLEKTDLPEKLAKSLHIVGTLFLEPGESTKNLSNVDTVLRWLASQKATRSDAILALGGGVMGDLAGFVASIYLRGLPFVQVPTTLLAMVDSSVGGKTGVNLPEGKNLVGAFYQPKAVFIDLEVLNSLPKREFAAGMAEVIKYGCIQDAALFARVTRPVGANDPDLAEIIARCVEIKAEIVEQDEYETKGLRALLNFGHTIGHAIEKATAYKVYLHGEAIALGMRAAARLSQKMETGLLNSEVNQLMTALDHNGLPTQITPEIATQCSPLAISAALGNDKKVAADGRNRWVLLNSMGDAVSGIQVPVSCVDEVIAELYMPFQPLPGETEAAVESVANS